MLNRIEVGDKIIVESVGENDPCYELRNAHIHGVKNDGTLVGGLVAEVTRISGYNEDGSLSLFGTCLEPNDQFGAIEGPFRVDNSVKLHALENVSRTIQAIKNNEIDFDSLIDNRPRHPTEVGDEIAFTHAFVKKFGALHN